MDHRLCFALLLFSVSLSAKAFDWVIPNPVSSQTEIWVRNDDGSAVDLWLLPDYSEGNPRASEEHFELASGQRLRLTSINPWQPVFRVRAYSNKLFFYFRHQDGASYPIPEGLSGNWYLRLTEKTLTPLLITNPTPVKQEVTLTHIDGMTRKQSPLGKVVVGPWAQIKWQGQTQLTLTNSYVAVSAPGVIVVNELPSLRALQPMPRADVLPSDKEGAWFVMGSGSVNAPQFMVHLKDVDLIAQARLQLQEPNRYMARILIGQIRGTQHFKNQNRNSRWKNIWSWEMHSPTAFAQMAHESCDGNPQTVEDFLLKRLALNPTICFWNYRIIQEVSKPLDQESPPPAQ